MQRLKQRTDFLHAARGVKWVAPAFVLQTRLARPRSPMHTGAGSGIATGLQTAAWQDPAGPEQAEPEGEARLGFTASRKVGGAVARNFARRRLREAARQVFPGKARQAHDYVLIARRSIGTCRFSKIVDDLETAIQKVHVRLDRSTINSKLTGAPSDSNRRPNK